jgi:S-DNA-T family DNA segregation ATPase FtsK/SpoIIIE
VPGWLSAGLALGEREDVPITPSLVVTALRDLGLTPLKNAIKAMPDAGAGMLSLIRVAGCGVELDVALPSGTETADIRKRQSRLAENLHRHEHEVHLTIPRKARTIRIWAADPGALDEPIGPSPLVYAPDLRADYDRGGAPWGQDLRGDPVSVALYQRHVLVTGVSNQGKTAALRALALWLALDPRVTFQIGDLKGVGDWAMFAGLAETLIEGPTDAHVALVVDMVEAAVDEMERRILAPKGTKWDPLIVIVDEAQVAFMCPAKGPDGRPYGGTKATSRFFMAVRKIHNQGRAVDVLMWEGTQDPTDENLPKIVREGAHLRASLVLGSESQARMALGDAAVDGGAAPHTLRQGLDKGTLVVFGDAIRRPPGQTSTTVRTHFIDDEPAEEVAERAKARRGAVSTADGSRADEPRDELADLSDSLRGEERAATTTVLGRLAEIDRRYYEGWNHNDLKALCERHGFRPRKVSTMWIYAEDVQRALMRREGGTPAELDEDALAAWSEPPQD